MGITYTHTTSSMKKKQKQPVKMSRLVKLKDQDRSFDLEFWERVGAQGRFEAAWDMVLDLVNWNKDYGNQQRLRRTDTSLQRRRS